MRDFRDWLDRHCVGITLIGAIIIVLVFGISAIHDGTINEKDYQETVKQDFNNLNCNQMKSILGDAKDKWFKSTFEEVGLKRMSELKC